MFLLIQMLIFTVVMSFQLYNNRIRALATAFLNSTPFPDV
jgi:hypothetical protein